MCRILDIPGYWISQDIGYPRILDIPGYSCKFGDE
jgi:hypothetical protein